MLTGRGAASARRTEEPVDESAKERRVLPTSGFTPPQSFPLERVSALPIIDQEGYKILPNAY